MILHKLAHLCMELGAAGGEDEVRVVIITNSPEAKAHIEAQVRHDLEALAAYQVRPLKPDDNALLTGVRVSGVRVDFI